MKVRILGVFLAVAFAAFPALAAEVAILPVGSTTIRPGEPVTLEVFVSGVFSPKRLRGYQVTIEIVPQAGASGSVGLVDPVTLDPDNLSLFIDKTRFDWVFLPISGTFAVGNVEKLLFGATIFNEAEALSVPDAKYLGTYILTPSTGTIGDFQINLLLVDPINPDAVPTFLLDPGNNLLSFTASGVTITVVPQAPTPDNDDCINRQIISAGVTAISTESATTDGPALDVACDEGGGVSLEQDVWYEHTATCTGVLTLSTCGDANFDTRLAVYGTGGSSCICPSDNTNLLECNDNTAGCAGGTSELSLLVTQGECLTLRLGGPGAAEGTGNLTITCAADLCADAAPLPVGSTASGSTLNTLLNDAIGPDCGTGVVDGPGVWFSVTGTGNLMTASFLAGASFDTRLTVYEGSCTSLSCVGDSDNVGSSLESVPWCSTMGRVYSVLVHGAGGESGTFSLNVADDDCSDGNACTDDTCSAAVCQSTPNFDAATDCCAPLSGSLTAISDSNPCTTDSCNAVTGSVSHTPVADGLNDGCDDAAPCTLDECISGACVNTDINTLSCTIDSDCAGVSTCGGDGLCDCVGATLELHADAGASVIEGCFEVGELISIRVELGPPGAAQVSPAPITGAQFFLEYDTTAMTFLGVDPGNISNPDSSFSFEISESSDAILGTVDYLIGVTLGSSGVVAPTTVAMVKFMAQAECGAFVRFRASGPKGAENLLVTSGGGQLKPGLVDLAPVKVNQNPPVLGLCPADIVVSPDSGLFTASVSYLSPSATDTCDAGSIPVTCDPPSGSVFDAGTTVVSCVAVDSCGLEDQCSFNVTVDTPSVTTDIQLSSTTAIGPFIRCITFDLWDCNGPAGADHVTIKQPVVFTDGVALNEVVQVPGGQWECMTARDELHTLTSNAVDFSTLDGIFYTASFMGSRASGGHWLLGGNLNGDDFIDILDFGVFFSQFLTRSDPDKPCNFEGSDANINGDNVIDLLDLVFLAGANALQASEGGCCIAAVASASEGPIRSITVRELRARGLDHLIAADVNGDGVLDQEDIIAFISSSPLPPKDDGAGDIRRGRTPTKNSHRPRR